MANSFVYTTSFQKKMRPYAVRIYQEIWPGCSVEDLRHEGVGVHVLDQHFAIDTLVKMPSGQSYSIQEKYRTNKFLTYNRVPDFTQEYMNGEGTPSQCEGEWFHLNAQYLLS